MPLILHIETATPVCSVALSRDGRVLGLKETSEKNSHSSVLTVFIRDIINSAGVSFSDLDAVAVSEGPGSYTGLRIGVATVKGLCYAIEKPLIGIPTLQAMAVGMTEVGGRRSEVRNRTSDLRHQTSDIGLLICPMIDARRMEVFSALYEERGKEVRETRAEIIDENSFSAYLEKNRILFAGDGAMKCKSILEHHPHAVFAEDFQPSAKFMIALSEEKYSQKKFEDLAYFEPYYLKDFVAGKPRVKGLK
ncbi:MAG: tRNA (adenosine(37)-N6)-threonylcarbamoyltransferase complex dimerization subunit type 1 TsaB [Bacteroidetes bacterium]|nr:tRNA (adenosine(37)-N6)-threonylcarbamoyltransferase complex dimerization subunit type 1 TsaB [Bacteroidota bacterium]